MRAIQFWLLSPVIFLLSACGSNEPAQIAATSPATVIAVEGATFTPLPPTPTNEATTPTPQPVEPAPATMELTTEPTSESAEAMAMISNAFVKEEVPVSGSFTLDPANHVLHLSDDFKVEQGPDLAIILSGATDLTLDYNAFGKTVMGTPLLNLGPLTQAAGAQDFTIPAETKLSLYNTVVVWCVTYNVAFAAAPLH